MLFKLLKRIDREHYSPMVISLTEIGEIGPRISALGVPVYSLGIKSALSIVFALPRLIRQIKRFKPDIVHTWLYHADLFGGIAARLSGIKAICWGIRSSNLDSDKTHWRTRAIRRICATLSHVIPEQILLNSEMACRIHTQLGYPKTKMSVIPNGFELSRFRPDGEVRRSVRASLGCNNDDLLVGMIGRFDPLKNHFGFISAMAIVHQYMPYVHFILVGNGIDRDNKKLIGSIELARLSKNTHLLGARDDVPELMTALDVLACTSHAEAFPNVIGEAMAAGVPCVATDVGDCAYIISDTGTVVPAGDMVGFALAVEKMLRLPIADRLALGLRARNRIASKFEIDNVVGRYQDLYESLKENTR